MSTPEPGSRAAVPPACTAGDARLSRAAPPVNRDSQFFWHAAGERRLVFQRCDACAELRHPPSPSCPRCTSLSWSTVDSPGRGRVFSFTIHHHPPVPGFDLPYIVALIEMDEGLKIVSNLVAIRVDEVAIGQHVEIDFVPASDGSLLPVFRPVHDLPASPPW